MKKKIWNQFSDAFINQPALCAPPAPIQSTNNIHIHMNTQISSKGHLKSILKCAHFLSYLNLKKLIFFSTKTKEKKTSQNYICCDITDLTQKRITD